MTLIHKHARVTKVHEKGDDRTVSGIISRESVDEDGEVMLAKGLDTDYNDRVGGVSVLWNHDQDRPIGKVRRLTPSEDGWMASVYLEPGVEKSDDALKLAKAGILHFSIGAKRLEGGPPTQDEKASYPGVSYVTRQWRLMELTLTPVPAHADARVVTKSLRALAERGDISQATVSEFAPPETLTINFAPEVIDIPDIVVAPEIPKV